MSLIWKSGFYHIERIVNIPIVLSLFDYRRHVGGLGPAMRSTGDLRADMLQIRGFYADGKGKCPELFAGVRLEEEM